MHIHCTGICRGRGAAYLSFEFALAPQCCDVRCASFSEKGTPLPVEAYRLDEPHPGRVRYVLVIPLLDTKKVRFEVHQLDAKGAVLARGARSFSRSFIKWVSRFNYRFDRDGAMAMRDIEQSAYAQQVHVVPSVFVSSPSGEHIVKGYACAPIGEALSFHVLDGQGHPIAEPRLLLGKSATAEALGMGRFEQSFTLRVPANGSTHCLVAEGSDGSRAGFLCLDAAACNYYADSKSPLLYRSTGPKAYGDRVRARVRMLALVDRAGYAALQGPVFSIIVPLYKTPLPFLHEMVESVRSQVYRSWELILVNASPEDAALAQTASSYEGERIRVVTLEENAGIAGNTNVGIEHASGDYIVFFDHDDTLDPFALYSYARLINEDPSIDALYCDEDFLNEAGEYVAPHFKSDFNLDLLRCHNYITHLLAVRASYAKSIRLRSEFDGAQDYDFLLHLVEQTTKIAHVPDVLYHWRISDTSTAKSAGNKGYADEAGRRALQAHLDRCGIAGAAERTDQACFYRVSYEIKGSPLVSILIPNKDNADVLRRCVDSIQSKTTYRSFEIIIIENNSECPETFAYYDEVQRRFENVHVVTWDAGFNYSAINNFGVQHARGAYFLLLNNDVEVISPDWMGAMLGICQRDDVGAVGARLLYPDDTVQHAGVMMVRCEHVNDHGGPLHVFSHLDRDDPGYMRRALLVQDLSAVTAACLMTKRDVFEALGGLDEAFAVAFNDIDYCLRVREMGKLVVYTPEAVLYHYESLSRGSDASGANVERFVKEQGRMRMRWNSYYVHGDPYHGPASTMGYYPETPRFYGIDHAAI